MTTVILDLYIIINAEQYYNYYSGCTRMQHALLSRELHFLSEFPSVTGNILGRVACKVFNCLAQFRPPRSGVRKWNIYEDMHRLIYGTVSQRMIGNSDLYMAKDHNDTVTSTAVCQVCTGIRPCWNSVTKGPYQLFTASNGFTVCYTHFGMLS